MDAVREDCYVVFLRTDRAHDERRECVEEPLADCPSYEDARQIQQAYRNSGRECVIRFVGTAGGGD
ncbi:MAG TPA: hypothetical protein VJ739_11725 [Gemmataceae bacterium]|nr:hypothetical protein [Gemmataceae bacterium]